MSYLTAFIIFGFFVTAIVGLLASWVDRKVTARLQYRIGPPLLQPVFDLIKLLGKETTIPQGASYLTFFGAPVMGLASVALVSTILWMNNINPRQSFVGDLIVVLYLFTIPSVSLVIGGFASRNPLASLGASREMKLILGYELPFILAVCVPVIKSGLMIQIGQILIEQQQGIFLGSWSGAIAFLVAVFCVQAKMGVMPFDIAEAETEIASGVLIEYSGVALGIFRLMKNMLLCSLPFFLMILFMGGLRLSGIGLVIDILKYVGIVALMVVIRNTNARARVDQAVRFFWGPMTLLAVLAVLLAVKGL